MQDTRPRVFVSFSSQDRQAARRLFARLEAQPLDVWNYADEEQEVPGGARLAEYLRARIDQSDFFLPLVSAKAFDSPYSRLEVEHALTLTGLRILPLVMSDAGPSEGWPEPYTGLDSFRYRAIDLSSAAALEPTIVDLCRDMWIRHVELPWMDPRLPFMPRFMAEVDDRIPRESEHDIAVYGRLMDLIAQFTEDMDAGDFPRALSRIAYFTLACEYEFPSGRFYYPYVVKGVCEILCGQLLKAEETIRALLDHPGLDENVFGALGVIEYQRSSYRAALDHYREATRRDPADPSAQAGVVLNSLLCGEPVDLDSAFEQIENAPPMLVEDEVKVRTLKAYALAHVGRMREAENALEDLVRNGLANPKVLANLADILRRQNRQVEAWELLGRFHDRFEDANLLHMLASLTFTTGESRRAAERFRELVRRYPDVRQYRVEAAQVFWSLGDKREAREVTAPMLDGRSFPTPSTPDDFFYDGFANWFHGRHERADYDFERSGSPPSERYDGMIAALRR